MKILVIILLVSLFLSILYFFSSYTGFFSKITPNETTSFYIIRKVRIEQGKILILNISLE